MPLFTVEFDPVGTWLVSMLAVDLALSPAFLPAPLTSLEIDGLTGALPDTSGALEDLRA